MLVAMDALTHAPSLDDIEAVARQALKTLPAEFAQHIDGVALRIEDFPDRDIELELGLESPFDLLGLYQGVSIDRKSIGDVVQSVDMVFLYRRAILDYWCESGEDLEHLIRHVLIHEIGHHVGFSDDDMERIEAMK